MIVKKGKTNRVEKKRAANVSSKTGKTHLGTINKIYGKDYGTDSGNDLVPYLKKNGYDAMAEFLEYGNK